MVFRPIIGFTPETPFLLELRYTLPGNQADLELPTFPEDPAVQKVYLAAYLPQEQQVLGVSGPWTDEQTADSLGGYAGQRFGLPESGPGAVAGFGRRLAALTVDWLLCYLIALLFGNAQDPYFGFLVLGIWFLLTAAPVAVFGSSAGMTALGIRVASFNAAAVIGVPRAVVRTLLIALVLPPLIRDADGRGLHDRAARTVVVRTR